MIVSRAATIERLNSYLSIENTPMVKITSCIRATTAPRANCHSKRNQIYTKTDITAKKTASIPFLTSSDETFDPTDSICKNFILGTRSFNKLLTLDSTSNPFVFSTLIIKILSLLAKAPALNFSNGSVASDIETSPKLEPLNVFRISETLIFSELDTINIVPPRKSIP